MPCAISAARGLTCKDAVGGVKAVYFAAYDPALYANTTITAGELTATEASFTAYRYDTRPNVSGLAVAATNDDAGSAAYEATLTLVLHTMTATDNVQLQALIGGLHHVFVLDANDQLWAVGLVNGCTAALTGGGLGTARADLNGYQLEIKAMEAFLPPAVAASADATDAAWPFDGVGGTGTITVTNPS